LTGFRLLSFVALALPLSGCGHRGQGETASPAALVDPATAGSIVGTVVFEGPSPPSRPIDMSASPACMQANPKPVLPPTVVLGDDGTLADAVVYVKEGLGNYRFDAPGETAVLQQKNCMYEPHVVALMTGQPFEVQNNDPTMHNVHPMPKHNRQWSNSQPSGSAALHETFTHVEFAMPVLCNVHPWMRALVFVFDHPYYAVTPREGNFELKNLPPGTYTIEAWHETLGVQDQTVTLGPRESKRIVLAFKSSPQ
jgi:plastocyanin